MSGDKDVKRYRYPERIKRWKLENKERNRYLNRRGNLKRKYGITPEQYDALLNKQKGVCAICGNVCKTKQPLSVDHCHKTNKVRGLLCRGCNSAIGKLNDDPKMLQRAAEYLNETETTGL